MYDSLNDLYEVSVELLNRRFCEQSAKKIVSIANKAKRETKRLGASDLKILLQQIATIDENRKFQKSHLAESTLKGGEITYKYVIQKYRQHISRVLLAITFTMPHCDKKPYQFDPQSALMALLQCIKESKKITIELKRLNWLNQNTSNYNQRINESNENWLKEAKEQIIYFKDKLGKYRLHKKFALEHISWNQLLQEVERSLETAQRNFFTHKQSRNKKVPAPSSTSLILTDKHPIRPINNRARNNQHKQRSEAYKRIEKTINYFSSFIPGHPQYEAEKALNMGADIGMNIKDRENIVYCVNIDINDLKKRYEKRFYRLPMSENDLKEVKDYLSLPQEELDDVKKLFKDAIKIRMEAISNNEDNQLIRINNSKIGNSINHNNTKERRPLQTRKNLAQATKLVKKIITALEGKWFWGKEERLKLEGILTGLEKKGKSYNDISSVLRDEASYIRDSSNIFSRLVGKKKFETETLWNVLNGLNRKMDKNERRELLQGLISSPSRDLPEKVELSEISLNSIK